MLTTSFLSLGIWRRKASPLPRHLIFTHHVLFIDELAKGADGKENLGTNFWSCKYIYVIPDLTIDHSTLTTRLLSALWVSVKSGSCLSIILLLFTSELFLVQIRPSDPILQILLWLKDNAFKINLHFRLQFSSPLKCAFPYFGSLFPFSKRTCPVYITIFPFHIAFSNTSAASLLHWLPQIVQLRDLWLATVWGINIHG